MTKDEVVKIAKDIQEVSNVLLDNYIYIYSQVYYPKLKPGIVCCIYKPEKFIELRKLYPQAELSKECGYFRLTLDFESFCIQYFINEDECKYPAQFRHEFESFLRVEAPELLRRIE
jgi:hypothetical protein